MTGRQGLHSRESVLAMVAQVERQGNAITARYAGGEGISGRFRDFQTFVDQIAQYQLFIDMVEARLSSLDDASRDSEAKKLIEIRWRMLQMEVEATNLFLMHMVANQTPWPMGSQPFLRRRLRRLDDVTEFHAEYGARYQLAPPDAAGMQTIRDQVGRQIGSSITLDDFSVAAPEAAPQAAPAEESLPEADEVPASEMQPGAEALPELPPAAPPMAAPLTAVSKAEALHPAASAPASPEAALEIPMVVKPAAEKPLPQKPAPTKLGLDLSSFDMPALGLSAAPPPAPEKPAADGRPPVPGIDDPIPDDWVLKTPATMPPPMKATPKPAPKPAAKPGMLPGAPKIPRSELRLKVRHDSGYNYIDGHGLAVITEACRVANTSIDELAKSLELSRPGLVLILNGKDPVNTELLKTLKRFVVKTGGMIEGQ